MKSTGIVRRVDDLGRYVIPKSLRYTLGIATGDALEVFVNGDEIVLKKYDHKPGCKLCGKQDLPMATIIEEDDVCIYCIGMIHKNEAQILRESALV